MAGTVTAVSRSATHSFSKPNTGTIRLIAGLGVEGDAHQGATVKHRSRVARDPTVPNLRQVHLMHAELFEELRGAGFIVSAGQMGENVTTRGIGLLDLPVGARLKLGDLAGDPVNRPAHPVCATGRRPGRADGGDQGSPRAAGLLQGRRHGRGPGRRGGQAGRPHPGGIAGRAAPAA